MKRRTISSGSDRYGRQRNRYSVVRRAVERIEDAHHGDAVVRRAVVGRPVRDRADKLLPLALPRIVGPVKVELGYCGRSALCVSFHLDQALDAVALPEPLDHECAARPENLEREEVLPLRPARVKARDRASGVAEQGEGIVFERRDGPDRALAHTVRADRIAREPANQVEQMHALIGQFATARKDRIAAPLVLVARPAAVAVTRPQVDQRTETSRRKTLASARERRMVAVVETRLEQSPRTFGRFGERRR